MKNIIFVFASALVGVSALNGMSEKGISEIRDIDSKIMEQAINSSSNLDEAIDWIKKFSNVYGVQFDNLFENNLKGFTIFVHRLADKFKVKPGQVFPRFGKIKEQYFKATRDLEMGIRSLDVDMVKESIAKGADLNSWGHRDIPEAALFIIFQQDFDTVEKAKKKIAIVKMLLDYGANPNLRINRGETPLYALYSRHILLPDDPTYEPINQLLENAMKKQQK